MTNPLDQLNLRPQEKRVLVVVLLLIFIVLNFWFVRPIFGQFGKMQIELEKSRRTLAKFEQEIAKTPTYQRQEDALKKEGGDVLNEELQLQRIVDNQSRASGVTVSRWSPGARTSTGRTNQFFEDQGLGIEFMSGKNEIVEFLVGLASGNSMIRVQEMNLRPDGTGTKLAGTIQFVASYQKKPAAAPKPVAPVSGTPTKAATVPAKESPTAAKTLAPVPPASKVLTNYAANKAKAAPVTGKAATNSAKPK